MNKISVIAAVLALLWSAAPAMAASSPDEAAITKIENDFATAQSIDDLVAFYDKNVVFYGFEPGEIDGQDAARAYFAKAFSGLSNFKATILRMKVHADTKIGFAYSVQHLVADGKAGSPGMNIVFRQTDCFEKKAGKWLIVHQQFSLPVDMSTGKAVPKSE